MQSEKHFKICYKNSVIMCIKLNVLRIRLSVLFISTILFITFYKKFTTMSKDLIKVLGN